MQWLYEDGATPFLRAAQSGDVTVMKLLLEHGADPKVGTANGDTALMVAAGIGWVDGDGRTAPHGAAHKGRNDVVRLLVEHGAKLDARDKRSRDTFTGALHGHIWMPIDYSRGLVRVGV
jgi:ankyrin repeat protein